MNPQRRRVCDYCNDKTALLYCRADSAKLCFSCDREVHGTNQLFTKHSRFLLCDACDDSPATIFCSTESSVFCQNCDWKRHNLSLSLVHDRRPLEGFNGCPSVSEILGILGFEDFDKKALTLNEERDEFFAPQLDGSLGLVDGFWETPSVVSLDDLILSNSSRNFQALGIPPLPKNRNAVCGQHKEEVLVQLRELAKVEPNSNDENVDAADSLMGFQPVVPEQSLQPGRMWMGSQYDAEAEPNTVPTFETHACQWYVDNDEAAYQDVLPDMLLRRHLRKGYKDSDKRSEISDTRSHANDDGHNERSPHPMDSRASSDYQKVAPYELSSQEREGAISRYKEKRKTRRYDKRIRYESRKVRAECRTRIKGRFAKIDH
ncbi:Zinc finger-domain containing protein [Parasponia andersonii]|uniref:Zinc finger-domain containing protein n=1 Tax=Parasponia andersonii TaxID=3476 RepID=A0A2P5C7Z0_PARAD|nr:Zinc finger-domain containing protein [Parasponia andersonii]